MPERWQQRRFPRYPIQLPCLHRVTALPFNERGAGWTRALSEGGASVELSARLRPQTLLCLRLQTDRGAIEVEAQVAWVGGRPPAGGGIVHGLAFRQIAPDQLGMLRDLLLHLSLARHAGVRLPLDLPVTCRPRNSSGPRFDGRTGNANRGGLLLRLPRLLPPGTTLEVTLSTANDPLTTEGTVVWVDPPEIWTPGKSIGHGFQFTAPRWTTLVSLGFLLANPA